MTTQRYSVATLRAAGLQARWGRNGAGAPILFARDPEAEHRHQRETWWMVDAGMWAEMQKEGIRKTFDQFTLLLLGDVFSVRA
jgi:hypothetical protein